MSVPVLQIPLVARCYTTALHPVELNWMRIIKYVAQAPITCKRDGTNSMKP